MPKVTFCFEDLEFDGKASKVKIHQRETIKPKDKFQIENLKWTEKQKQFIELALNKETQVLLTDGPAGTSKTLLATYCALHLLNQQKVSDIIYMRSAVESSEARLGFLPGDAEEKLQYYNLPFMDKLDELISPTSLKNLQKDKRISCHPVNFARGMSWNAKCIIFDECQNSSLKEIITVLTRMGQFSKIFLLADPTQTDLKNGNRGGFKKIYDLLNDEKSKEMGINTFKFGHEDVVRSELVKYLSERFSEMASIS
tara:strand:+ start:7642 stop:8406 length:765 start_codon:yes stop_codon:yes gene_type:complete